MKKDNILQIPGCKIHKDFPNERRVWRHGWQEIIIGAELTQIDVLVVQVEFPLQFGPFRFAEHILLTQKNVSDSEPGDLWHPAVGCRNILVHIRGAEDPERTRIRRACGQGHAIDRISHIDHG